MQNFLRSRDPRSVGRGGSKTAVRGRAWRAVRIGAVVAGLALMAAVPALAAVTSSVIGDFAPTGASGDNHWHNSNQSVTVNVFPSTDTTATAHFSADGGTDVVDADGYDHRHGLVPLPRDRRRCAPRPVLRDRFGWVRRSHEDGRLHQHRQDQAGDLDDRSGCGEHAECRGCLEQGHHAHGDPGGRRPGAEPGTATAGVRRVVYRVNSGSVETSASAAATFVLTKGIGGVTEGSNAVTYSAIDWAGNIETTATAYVNIDTVAPTTTASPSLPSTPSSGWVNTPSVLVTLTTTDASSGVPTGGTSYRLDTGNLTIYGAPFPVTKEGSTELTYRSVDRALNVEATRTAYVNIDTAVPTVSAAQSPSRSSGWYNKDVTVTLTPQDSLSGVATTQYRLQADPPAAWTNAAGNQFVIPATDNGAKTYEYQTVDNAGNVSAAASLSLTMDSVAPKTYGKNASGKVRKPIKLKYKITDNLSPKAYSVQIKVKNSRGHIVKKVSFSGTKSLNKWYSYSWKPSAKGTYKYYVYAKDKASNPQAKAGRGTVKVK